MKAHVNSVTYWDVFFLNKIFRLDGKKLVSAAVPWLSHSGDGYCYPALPLLVYLIEPTKALPVFTGRVDGICRRASALQVHEIMYQA
jgi:hypothetical protein